MPRQSRQELAIDADSAIVRQMDELQRKAKDHRDKKLGTNWERDFEQFYEIMADPQILAPAFAPHVNIPALQMLMLHEATDLAAISPKIYIAQHQDWSDRDKNNELALEAQWQQSRTNHAILYAIITALFTGRGFVQIGYDTQARMGLGDIYADWRKTSTVFTDPNAKCDKEWRYVMWEDRVYIDDIRADYPEKWRLVRQRMSQAATSKTTNAGGKLPPGPMSEMPSLGFTTNSGSDDGTVRRRTLFIRDHSVMEAERIETTEQNPPNIPNYVKMYPNGRHIVEAEGVVLYDDNSWVPNGRFPLFSFSGLPGITGFWAPPPTRWTKSLQEMSEKMTTQTYESMVRMNRQMAFIRQDSGIDVEDFANLPAAAYEYAMTSVPPTFAGPPGIPSEYLQQPSVLLELQRDLQGFPLSRTGKAPAGNISAPLFEAAISQSQALTRLRAILMEDPVADIGEMILMAMQVFYTTERIIPGVVRGRFNPIKWTPIDPKENILMTRLDPSSVRPLSQTAQRMMVPLLRQLQMLDTKHGLDMLDIPEGEEIAQALAEEQKAGMLAKMKGRGPK